MAFITAIAKRFEGSGFSDKSVDQAVRGKHYRRIVRALQLMYETLQRRIIRRATDGGLKLSEDVKLQLEQLRNTNHDMSKSELMKIVRNVKKIQISKISLLKPMILSKKLRWLSAGLVL